MTGTVNLLTSRRILLLASNPAISGQTGWPIGFWWAELSHPYWEFTRTSECNDLVVSFCEAGKVTAVVCHATSMLLKARLPDGDLLVKGKTWTGFANSEEDYSDEYVGQRIQPFRIEDQARAIAESNFIVLPFPAARGAGTVC